MSLCHTFSSGREVEMRHSARQVFAKDRGIQAASSFDQRIQLVMKFLGQDMSDRTAINDEQIPHGYLAGFFAAFFARFATCGVGGVFNILRSTSSMLGDGACFFVMGRSYG